MKLMKSVYWYSFGAACKARFAAAASCTLAIAAVVAAVFGAAGAVKVASHMHASAVGSVERDCCFAG